VLAVTVPKSARRKSVASTFATSSLKTTPNVTLSALVGLVEGVLLVKATVGAVLSIV
jgi:hypothetical protein